MKSNDVSVTGCDEVLLASVAPVSDQVRLGRQAKVLLGNVELLKCSLLSSYIGSN